MRTAVEALDGAAWVSVEWCGDCPPGLPWLRVWAAGDSTPRAGGALVALAAMIRVVTVRALVAA